jgi:hypothetical protein
MKKTYLFPFLLLFLFFTENLFSWDTTASKYFPLKVGNSWTYRGEGTFPGPCWTREKHTVTGTTVYNGHLYFTVHYIGYNSPSDYFLRIDSTNMNVLRYASGGGCPWTPSEKLLDSLRSRMQDSFKVECTNWWKSIDTTWQNVIGVNRPTKRTFWDDGFEQSQSRYLSRDFGLTKWVNCAGAAGCCTKTLIGCLINGIIYGDTSLTGINPISNNIPEEFSLSQNYPNPFNPVTNIEFSIPGSAFVNLFVYDISGKKLETMVNQNMQAGFYRIDWNASKYSSGVYYYRLEAGKFTETKKMVLLK